MFLVRACHMPENNNIANARPFFSQRGLVAKHDIFLIIQQCTKVLEISSLVLQYHNKTYFYVINIKSDCQN